MYKELLYKKRIYLKKIPPLMRINGDLKCISVIGCIGYVRNGFDEKKYVMDVMKYLKKKINSDCKWWINSNKIKKVFSNYEKYNDLQDIINDLTGIKGYNRKLMKNYLLPNDRLIGAKRRNKKLDKYDLIFVHSNEGIGKTYFIRHYFKGNCVYFKFDDSKRNIPYYTIKRVLLQMLEHKNSKNVNDFISNNGKIIEKRIKFFNELFDKDVYLLFDDIDQADEFSVKFIKELTKFHKKMVFTAKNTDCIFERMCDKVIKLNALKQSDLNEFIDDEDLVLNTLRKSKGIPFFIMNSDMKVLEKLSQKCLSILQVCSCLGSSFDISIVNKYFKSSVYGELFLAIKFDIINEIDILEYEFTHDYWKKKMYKSITKKDEMHKRIAFEIHGLYGKKKVFKIINQLSFVNNLTDVINEEEKKIIVNLYSHASKLALYNHAIGYRISNVHSLLPKTTEYEPWKTDYKQMFFSSLNSVYSLMIQKRHREAMGIIENIRKHIKSKKQLLKLLTLLMICYGVLNLFSKQMNLLLYLLIEYKEFSSSLPKELFKVVKRLYKKEFKTTEHKNIKENNDNQLLDTVKEWSERRIKKIIKEIQKYKRTEDFVKIMKANSDEQLVLFLQSMNIGTRSLTSYPILKDSLYLLGGSLVLEKGLSAVNKNIPFSQNGIEGLYLIYLGLVTSKLIENTDSYKCSFILSTAGIKIVNNKQFVSKINQCEALYFYCQTIHLSNTISRSLQISQEGFDLSVKNRLYLSVNHGLDVYFKTIMLNGNQDLKELENNLKVLFNKNSFYKECFNIIKKLIQAMNSKNAMVNWEYIFISPKFEDSAFIRFLLPLVKAIYLYLMDGDMTIAIEAIEDSLEYYNDGNHFEKIHLRLFQGLIATKVIQQIVKEGEKNNEELGICREHLKDSLRVIKKYKNLTRIYHKSFYCLLIAEKNIIEKKTSKDIVRYYNEAIKFCDQNEHHLVKAIAYTNLSFYSTKTKIDRDKLDDYFEETKECWKDIGANMVIKRINVKKSRIKNLGYNDCDDSESDLDDKEFEFTVPYQNDNNRVGEMQLFDEIKNQLFDNLRKKYEHISKQLDIKLLFPKEIVSLLSFNNFSEFLDFRFIGKFVMKTKKNKNHTEHDLYEIYNKKWKSHKDVEIRKFEKVIYLFKNKEFSQCKETLTRMDSSKLTKYYMFVADLYSKCELPTVWKGHIPVDNLGNPKSFNAPKSNVELELRKTMKIMKEEYESKIIALEDNLKKKKKFSIPSFINKIVKQNNIIL